MNEQNTHSLNTDNMTEEAQQTTAEVAENEASLSTDESVAGTNHLSEPVAEENALETLQAELTEQKDKYLRLFAEFDNYKRRTAKERIELMQTAGREIITALLDVLDDCERAEKVMAGDANPEAVKEGVTLVFHKLRSTLEQKGLKAMQSVHTEFDADLHEAITEVPVPDEALKGKVVDEVQKGYMLGEKIIRYAKVVVGK
jgi:molecular chaperone GrpE